MVCEKHLPRIIIQKKSYGDCSYLMIHSVCKQRQTVVTCRHLHKSLCLIGLVVACGYWFLNMCKYFISYEYLFKLIKSIFYITDHQSTLFEEMTIRLRSTIVLRSFYVSATWLLRPRYVVTMQSVDLLRITYGVSTLCVDLFLPWVNHATTHLTTYEL